MRNMLFIRGFRRLLRYTGDQFEWWLFCEWQGSPRSRTARRRACMCQPQSLCQYSIRLLFSRFSDGADRLSDCINAWLRLRTNQLDDCAVARVSRRIYDYGGKILLSLSHRYPPLCATPLEMELPHGSPSFIVIRTSRDTSPLVWSGKSRLRWVIRSIWTQ